MVNMKEHYQKMRDFYAHKPGARIYQREFGFFTLDRWKAEGYIQDDTDLAALFGFDPEAKVYLGGLGWCEPEFCPWFEKSCWRTAANMNWCRILRDAACSTSRGGATDLCRNT